MDIMICPPTLRRGCRSPTAPTSLANDVSLGRTLDQVIPPHRHSVINCSKRQKAQMPYKTSTPIPRERRVSNFSPPGSEQKDMS